MNTPLSNISSLLKKVNKLLSPTASAQASHQRCNCSNNHDDNFQSTVCLYDWWLIKSDEIFEGKRLAVTGYTSRELKARRVFTSAPIVKQYDIFTVESADGICIILKGLMNKLRAKENGFSAEDFSHFLYGFPPSWEAYNKKCLEEEFTTGPSLATIPSTNGAATGHDVVAGAGMKNTNPNTTPINYKVNGKNKHNVEDINEGSENISEKVTTNASKGSDWQNHAAFEECPIAKASEVENLNSSNLDPAVSMGDSGLDLRITSRKSKTQEPACLESISIGNAASGECSISDASKGSYWLNHAAEDNIEKAKDHASENLLPSMSLPKDNLALPAELMPKISECSDGESLKSCSSGTAVHSGRKIDILEAALSQYWQSIYKMVLVGSATLVSDGTSNFDIPMEGIDKFDFCDDQCESEAAVGERKINFDMPGRKENIVFPESLSLKRSRSGRLLLPSLDFWRNEIAVYDADRKIIGIQVARPDCSKKKKKVARPLEGSKSKPPPKKRSQ